MKTKSKVKIILATLFVAAIAVFAFAFTGRGRKAYTYAETWTAPDGGWNQTTENGETVWTRAANTVYTTKGSEITGNALEFELRMNSKQSSDDKVFVQYGTPTGGEYNFVFNHFTSKFTIGRSFGLESNGYPSGDYYTEESYSQNNGEWVKLRMVFAEHYLAAYKVTESGDTLIALTTNTWDTDRFVGTGAYVNIRGWNTDYSIKNPKVVSVALPDTDSVWKAYKGWTVAETGGETVYTRNANEVLSAKVEAGKNALELDLRVEHEDKNADSMNIVQYADGGGNTYGFIYNTRDNTFTIGKYKGIGSSVFPEHDTLASVSYTQVKDTWVKLKYVFSSDLLAVYKIGETDELIVSYVPTDAKDTFANGHVCVKGFNTALSVKNMRFTEYAVAPPEPETWSVLSGWETSTESGETVYHRTANGIISTRNVKIEGNTLDVDLKIAGRYTDVENLVIFNIIDRSGKDYGFKYDHLGYTFSIGEYTGDDGNNYPEYKAIASESCTLAQGEWVKLRFVFDEGFLGVYEVSGSDAELIVWTDSAESSFDDCYIDIRGWNTDIYVKGMTLSETRYEIPTPELWSIISGWEKNTDSGETVYRRTVKDGILSTRNGNIEGNALEVDVRISGRYTDAENLTVFNVINRGGKTYAFKYDHLGHTFSIAEHTGEDANGYPESSNIATASYTMRQNEWVRLRLVFDKRFFAVYEVSGASAKSVVSTYNVAGDFDDCYIDIRGWNTALEVKGMEFVAVAADPSDIGFIDLTFADASSVAGWAASAGEIRWQEALALTLENGARFTSPAIDVARGDKYSALLTVRNTLVVRLKNESTASEIKVYFVTSASKTYSDDKCEIFGITPNSDYKTYYFNLSGNAAAKGYLRGFAFEFEAGAEGQVLIDEITFAREDPIYDYAGAITSCTATEQTVTVVGTLDEKYNGKTVTVYESAVENYLESLTYKGGMTALGTTVAANGEFTVTFPFKNGDMTRLSTFMIAAVDGVKVDKTFKIQNYADFTENPYEFELGELTVDATAAPYSAKGDGFTNDDAAIQAAIDYVSAQPGGGKVVLPGDVTTSYGRRYLVTGIELKSNVELVIETGAVLWQSHRREEYTKYDVFIGHENMGGSVAWGLSALMHYPLVYIHDAQNVKVTGGGTIRMDDTGTEWLDGNGYSWDSNIMVGCTNVVHLVPIGIYGCRNVEIKDITIKRASCWHFYVRESSNIYIGNVDMNEVNCINGDGIDFSTAVHDVIVDRCSLYSNDDALVLAVTTNDPRDDRSIWREKCKLDDKTVHGFTIKSSNLFGGHGITFIPWASDNSDAEKVEIYDITVTDCVLGGTSTPVGAWADNPFYGKSNYFLGTYGHTDHAEKDDYSPIRDITIVNNVYNGNCSFYGIQVANLVTDANMRGATGFVNGNFDKTVHTGAGYADESTWTTGLSYWSHVGETVGTDKKAVGKGYSAYLGGDGELYQGFYKILGAYEVSVDAMLEGGSATLFVRDASGKTIAEQPLEVGTEFEEQTLSFKLERGMLVRVGVKHEGAQSEKVWLDDASITAVDDPSVYEVDGDEMQFELDDADNYRVYSSSGAGVRYENGSLVTGSGGEYKIMLANSGKLGDHAVSVDIAAPSGSKIDAGLYLFAKDAGNSPDDIDAYNVQVESVNGTTYTVKLFRFKGYYVQGALATSAALTVADGLISLKAVVKNGTIYVFADGGTEPVISYEVTDAEPGNVGLRSNGARATFLNFKLTAVDYAEATGDRTELDGLLELAALFSAPGYTEQSFGRLEQAVAAAKALSENAKQSEIDAVSARIRAAINSLEPATAISAAKTELTVAIGFAEQLDKTLYSEASYKELQSAIDVAKTLLNGEATKEQLKAATTTLLDAVSKLEAAPSSNANGDDNSDGGFNGLALGLCLAGLAVGALGAVIVMQLIKKRKEKK